MELRPNDLGLRLDCGEAHAEMEKWEKAAEQFVAAITTMQPLGWQGWVSSLAASSSQRSMAPRAVGSSSRARAVRDSIHCRCRSTAR